MSNLHYPKLHKLQLFKAFFALKMDEIQFLHLVFAAFLSISILLWSIKRFHKTDGIKNFPPSPPKLPILGNLHQLGSLPHRNLRSLAGKYGPLMLLHFGRVPVLIVSSADTASEVLKTHDVTFASRPQFKAFKKLVYNAKNITFSPYGESWRQLKSIFVLQLLSTKRVKSSRPIREEETILLVKKIQESSGRVNLSEMFAEFSTDVISRSVLGFKYRELGNGQNLLQLLVDLMELLGIISIGDFIPWLNWIDRVRGFDARMVKVAAEMDEFLEDVIQQRVRYGRNNGDSFIDILLEIHNRNKDGDSISRNGIKALVMVSAPQNKFVAYLLLILSSGRVAVWTA